MSIAFAMTSDKDLPLGFERYDHTVRCHRIRRRILDAFGIPWEATPKEQEKYLSGLTPDDIKVVLKTIPKDDLFAAAKN